MRLSDVAPDGAATRVSYQVLNLTHRDSHEHPEALVPGHDYEVTVVLSACGHRFMPGHRVRLSIGTAYWPTVWPAPYPATLTIRTRGSALELPVRAETGAKVSFPLPAHGPQTPIVQLDAGSVKRYTVQDHVSGETTYVTDAIGGVFGEGVLRFEAVDVEIAHGMKRELTIKDDDPLSARYLLTQSYAIGRDGWRTVIDTRLRMHSDRDTFYLSGTLTARHNGAIVAEREWNEAFSRDLV